MSNQRLASDTASAVSEAITASGRALSDVARATGIPYVTLRRKVAGHTAFRLSELFLIAEATGTTPGRFLPRPSDPLIRS